MCLLRTTVTSVWTIAACSGIPYLVIYDTVEVRSSSPGGRAVEFCVVIGDYDLNAYTVTSFVLWYVVPLVMMTYVYCRISVVLWRSSRNTALSSSTGGSGSGGGVVGGGGLGAGSCNYAQMNMTQMNNPGVSNNGPNRISGEDVQDNESYTQESDSDSRWPTTKKKKVATDSYQVTELRSRPSRVSGTADTTTTSTSKKSVSFRMPTVKRMGNALNSRRKVIRVLIALVASFALCVLPYHVRVLWQDFNRSNLSLKSWHRLITPLTFIIYYLNSALNPILYAFLSDKFRSSFMDFSRCRRRNRSPGGASITMRTVNSSVESHERKLSQTVASVLTLK